MRRANEISFRSELLRKGIHLLSLSIPIGYYYVSRDLALAFILPMFIISLVLDVSRYSVPPVGRFFDRWFAHMLREHELDPERRLLNGATYVLASAAICIEIFPKIVTVTAFGILIVSDSAAALFGRRFGKHHFFQKSVEGAVAFFLSAVIVVLAVPRIYNPPIEIIVGVIAAAIAAVVEAASIEMRLDDNLSIPLSVGGVMMLTYWLLAQISPATFAPLFDAVRAFA
jgi:dolichol kinase